MSLEFILSRRSIRKYTAVPVMERDVDDLLRAAVEDLLLAGHAKGLGAVWVGLYPVKERMLQMRELLGVPPLVVPLALIPIGHPAESKPPGGRFNVHRIHRNRW